MAYKKLQNDCGIYQIRNLKDGKVYIGSSSRLHGREREHMNSLSRGDHPNIHLQRAFDRDGADSLCFEILELCLEDELTQKEQQYLDILTPEQKYNICERAYIPEPLSTKVAQYTLSGEFVKVWNSIRKAARFAGVDPKTILSACKGMNASGGRCISSGGFQWRIIKEGEPFPLSISPAMSAIRRNGKTWPEYWRTGDYSLYIWDLQGNLREVSNDIFDVASRLQVRVNLITRVLRRERQSLKGVTFSLNNPNFPGYRVKDGYANGVKLRLEKSL